MKAKIVIGGTLFIIVGAIASWYFLSPMLTLQGLKSAFEKKDGVAVGEYVDFEALKSDLKSDLNLAMLSELEKDASGMAGMGAAMGMAMVNPMIDALVSPAGIEKLLKEAPDPAESALPANLPNVQKLDEDYTIERIGISKFRLVAKEAKDAGLIFERRGLGWKVVGIDLPTP
jgi:Protein of unknown function (DUF2939)